MAKIVSKIKNVLKKKWVTILFIIWVLYFMLKSSTEYITVSMLGISIFAVMLFAAAYSIGQHNGATELELECDRKDERIEELSMEVEASHKEIESKEEYIEKLESQLWDS